MDIVYDPALAGEILETCEEFYMGFDARARPVGVRGGPGAVYFTLLSEESRESKFRQLVTYYYARFATRTPGPPQAVGLSAFVDALAADEINE